MSTLGCNEIVLKSAKGKTHNCDRCPYVTKSGCFMLNHMKRHQSPLELSNCKTNALEKYYCKNCKFQSDLVVIFNQHIKEYHGKNVDFVRDRLKEGIVVKSYICQKCAFETYSVLLWLKHLNSTCFNTKKDFEKVQIISYGDGNWYQCEYCPFGTKELPVLNTHKSAEHLPDEGEWFCCSHCKYKAKTKNHLKQHTNYEHAALEAVHLFHCNKCQYKSKSYFNLRTHKKIHLPAEAVQWYGCDKCEYKAKRKFNLKLHSVAKHLTLDKESNENCPYKTQLIDGVIYFECDYCSFKSKVVLYLKRHIQRVHPYVRWFQCEECDFNISYKNKLKCHKKKSTFEF
jgi:hypothetical protein